MQFFTSKTILYARVVFFFFLFYFAAVNPGYLLGSHFLLLLGQAMELPMILPVIETDGDSVFYGIISLLFGLQAVGDLIPLLAENVDYFETIVPTRLTIFFFLAAYAYISKSLTFGNNAVFVYSFFEVWFNFLIFNNLRDEKFYRLKHFVEKHGDQIQPSADVIVES